MLTLLGLGAFAALIAVLALLPDNPRRNEEFGE